VREEWSAIQLSHLPAGSISQTVVDLMGKLGLPLTQSEVVWAVNILGQSTETLSVCIFVDNKSFTTVFIRRLEHLQHRPRAAQTHITAESKKLTEVISTSNLTKAFFVTGADSYGQLVEDSTAQGDCITCTCEADDLIRTKCRHIFCRTCFENQCRVQSKDGIISCHGNGGECTTDFHNRELEHLLSREAFRDILETSFKAYIRQHPQLYITCPGPDCDQFYRKTTRSTMRTCRRAASATFFCTSCPATHLNMSCDEWKSTEDYASLQAYMKENNTKICPRCKNGIELIDGCDHVSCPCGAHVCFKCLASFDTAPECYRHMDDAHRGPFNFGPPQPAGDEDIIWFNDDFISDDEDEMSEYEDDIGGLEHEDDIVDDAPPDLPVPKRPQPQHRNAPDLGNLNEDGFVLRRQPRPPRD
jgi:hypothetical protein